MGHSPHSCDYNCKIDSDPSHTLICLEHPSIDKIKKEQWGTNCLSSLSCYRNTHFFFFSMIAFPFLLEKEFFLVNGQALQLLIGYLSSEECKAF